MDIIYIKGMRINTLVGAYAHEQDKKQPVVIDLELGMNAALRPEDDTFEALHLDYRVIGQRITEFVAQSHFQLIETMAESIYHVLRDEFKVPWARIKISKPKAAMYSDDVGLIIERGKFNA